jgi:hypothetical protein
MLKRDELTDPNSCLNRAADDEMIFVLLARDVATPHAIREWGLERVLRGKNQPEDAQIVEALQCAAIIAKAHGLAEPAGNSFSQNKAIRSKFPDPDEAAAYMEVEFLSPSTPNDTFRQIRARMRAFQRDTINTLADCLVREAGRLEAINGFVTVEDMKREAQALRDYAETLIPPAPEATR